MPPLVRDGLPELNASTRKVVTLLLRSGPLARVELARRLSLTPASLTKLTRPMLDLGVFQQVEPVDRASNGRPAQPLSIDPTVAAFIGIKLTGSRLYAVLTDLAGSVMAATDVALRSTDVPDILDQIVDAVNYLSHDTSVHGVGVSVGGPVIRSRGHVVASPFLGWAHVDLGTALENRIHCPVVVENDLRALTAGLHWFDDTLTSFALITFGAGIGCGLVVDDRLICGSGGAAGLIDHLRVDDHGPMCAQGHRGCVSGYASTDGILRAAAIIDLAAPPRTLTEVGSLARAGDPLATGVLQDAGYAIGCVVGTICNVTGPAQVILSGEGVELFDVLESSLRQGVADVMHPVLPPVPVSARSLTFTDWARGSAVAAIEHHLELRSTHA